MDQKASWRKLMLLSRFHGYVGVFVVIKGMLYCILLFRLVNLLATVNQSMSCASQTMASSC